MPDKVVSRWKAAAPDLEPTFGAEVRKKKPKAGDTRTAKMAATAKWVGSKALDGSGPVMNVGTNSAGIGGLAMATGAAAASATGVGLVVAGALLTGGATTKSIVAAVSSKHHRDNLRTIDLISRRVREFPCTVPDGADHDLMGHLRIVHNVLPYAIEQKDKKFKKRALGAVPVLGTLPVAIYTAYRSATKENKGQRRTEMAYELAVHLITHNCGLAQIIVAELVGGVEKMMWMMTQDSDVVTALIAEKLKSI
jgi:hypothetical protein